MTRADLKTGRRIHWAAVAFVAAVHVLLIVGLIRAFTPDFAANVTRVLTRTLAFTVPAETPPAPRPMPSPQSAPSEKAGTAGAPGVKAVPRELAVPPAKIAVRPTQAPPVTGPGRENAVGAATGTGTGASGSGQGMGSGTGGTGQAGGGATATVKIEGDINSARDYPRGSRDLRIGASVAIDLTVGTDGLVKACRVIQPSPDSEADRITCELAIRRFRFRPARDAFGNPVQAIYRWRQRWFY